MEVVIKNVDGFKSEIEVPGDKSITHRAYLISSLAEGNSTISGFSPADDCRRTLNCLCGLGVKVIKRKCVNNEFEEGQASFNKIEIEGKGLYSLKEPIGVLNAGNSGTTIRLLSGILAGNKFLSIISGDKSLNKRPMRRIIEPLRKMGAFIKGRNNDTYPPLVIEGNELSGIEYVMPVASAQVKSAILFAGLFAKDKVTIIEPYVTRNHTEKIFKYFNIDVKVESNEISLKQTTKNFCGKEIKIPGDFSSAASFLAMSTLRSDREILVKNVGLNPTRIKFLDVLRKMGAKIEFKTSLENNKHLEFEEKGDIYLKGVDELKPIHIGGEIVPQVIDEIPLIAVLATQAEGISIIEGAQELRIKESDRIKTITRELIKLGAQIDEKPDGMIIKGKTMLKGVVCYSHYDHRIAMSLAVAGTIARGKTIIKGAECVNISFPGFFDLFNRACCLGNCGVNKR